MTLEGLLSKYQDRLIRRTEQSNKCMCAPIRAQITAEVGVLAEVVGDLKKMTDDTTGRGGSGGEGKVVITRR